MLAGDIVLATWSGVCFGQRFMLTQTYQVKLMPGGIDDIAGQELLLTAWGGTGAGTGIGKYAACLSTGATVTEAKCQKIRPGRVRASGVTVNVAGNAGGSSTANVAASIELFTAIAARSSIGVKHVGPCATGSALAANGVWDTAYMDLFVALGDYLSTSLVFDGGTKEFEPCIFHRKLTQAPYGTPVIGSIVKNTVRVNRRRTVGVGE